MADDPDLLIIKRDERLVLSELGLQKSGNHCSCPICGDKTGLSVRPKKDGSGIWEVKCFSKGCVTGTVIDVVVARNGLANGSAIRYLKEKMGMKTHSTYTSTNGVRQPHITERFDKKKEEPSLEPELDYPKAEAFIKKYHSYLMNSDACIQKWLIGKRGISEAVAERYRLGFIENGTLPILCEDGSYFNAPVQACWVIPITDHKGVLKGIKLHYEIVEHKKDGSKIGKSGWVQFGKNGRHAYNCFWPHPYTQTKQLTNINYSENKDWWLSRIPRDIKDSFERRLGINLMGYADTNKKDYENLETKELEIIHTQTFDDMRKEIQASVIKTRRSAAPSIIDQWLIFVPGELKALANISAGFSSTSLTEGENTTPTSEMMRCMRGLRVGLMYDADLPYQLNDPRKTIRCPGREFAHKMVPLLESASALEVRIFTGGRR